MDSMLEKSQVNVERPNVLQLVKIKIVNFEV